MSTPSAMPRMVTTAAGGSSWSGELDLALRAVAQREAGDLPHGGGQAALRLGAELQEPGEVSCAAPREEHVLLRAQRKRDDRPPHPNRM